MEGEKLVPFSLSLLIPTGKGFLLRFLDTNLKKNNKKQNWQLFIGISDLRLIF
jgi:hypothetical protein